jgi:hypothetical protein
MRAVPSLREFSPGICLTTEEKAWKNLSQSKKNLSRVKKNLSRIKKNLSQSTVYILPKHPHITKPIQTHKLQNQFQFKYLKLSLLFQQSTVKLTETTD